VYAYVRVCVFVRVYSCVCGVCVRCVCVARVFVCACSVCVMVYVRVSTEIYGDVLNTSRFFKNRGLGNTELRDPVLIKYGRLAER